MQEIEKRTPYVVLDANLKYWNKERGPRLQRVVFRNDLSHQEALRLCMTTEGQVDIVTKVSPFDAERVRTSRYAKLVNVSGNSVVAGVFNRFQPDVSFENRRLREAFNLAIDRSKLIAQGFLGYAEPLPALTPPSFFDFSKGLKLKPHDPTRARELFEEAGWPKGRALRLAVPAMFAHLAQLLAADIQSALGIGVQVTAIPAEQQFAAMRLLAEKKLIPNWDIMLVSTQALFTEGTPAFIHREFFGADGAFRAGPKLAEFDKLFLAMSIQTNPLERLKRSQQIDRYVYDESLALFLCAPQALYAVNKHVQFSPYRTSLEFAETEVDHLHWSRRC